MHTHSIGKMGSSSFQQHLVLLFQICCVLWVIKPFSKLTFADFEFQLEKVYDPKNEEDDMVEMEEERLRMREHVMNEVRARVQYSS